MNLSEANNRRRIRIPLSPGDMVIEMVAAAFLLFMIILPLRYSGQIPDQIPTHFSATGAADAYGSKSTLWLLPAIGFVLWLGMTVLCRFPHIFNFSVKITPENAEVQYRLAIRMLRVLKTAILVMFSFIMFRMIKTATGEAAGLGKVFLPLMLTVTLAVVVIYMINAYRNRNQT
jgi:uncharacterized membrane protein